MAKKQKLALIDAHALIHRAYHALPPMTTRGGEPTGAAFGFTTMLLKMLQTVKPTHVVAAFDVKGPTFRHKQFKEYKAHRKKPDDELVAQFETVRRIVEAFGIPVVEKKGFEADDVIGTLTKTVPASYERIIVTGDMDTLQLVDSRTKVFTLKRGVTDTILYDEALVKEKYGFGPEYVVDYKGLAGDSSDNIPGVAGVGDKTARDLIGKYGGIEEIYAHLEELPTRAKTRLTDHQQDAEFSRTLATIKRDVPLDFSVADAALEIDADRVHELFEALEFRSLLNKIPAGKKARQATLFTAHDAKQVIETPEQYHLVEGEAEQKKLLKELLGEKVIAFDTENERLGAREWPIVGMSFAVRRGKIVEAWYVPVDRESVELWRPLLESQKVGKVGHNLKYDYQVLRQSDITLGPIHFDTMVGSYLLNPGARAHGLDTLALQELGHRCISITSLIGEGRDQKSMAEVPLEQLVPYACEDADISFRLYEQLVKRIDEEGLRRVMEELELPLVGVLAEMELAGVKLDAEVLRSLHRRVAGRITTLQKKIWEVAGEEFNVNSTVQLRGVLYEKLKLPTTDIRKTQSGYSTAASELAKLRDEHAIVAMLEEWREITKLQSTYIEPLPQLLGEDGRIHASFNQTVAATGRLSSADPNLQNIPVRTELGQEIRTAFVAERGKRLVKADYSQVELRLAAHLSGDERMIEVFAAGEDIHAATAAWVEGVEVSEVTPAQRRAAKTLNFGVLYGMGPQAFARAAGISLEEARSFIERYREQYAGLAAFVEQVIEDAEVTGFVETLFGRRRYVPELKSRAPAVRSAAERFAFNFPLQGSAADILKRAMIDVDTYLTKHHEEARMVLTVHDELVLEVPTDEVEVVAKALRTKMEGAHTLDVPLVVDVAAGKNWRDMNVVT